MGLLGVHIYKDTLPSTPPTTSRSLPAFITQSLESIHSKFSQIQEHEKALRPFSTSAVSHPVAFKRDRYFTIRPWESTRIELRDMQSLEHPYLDASHINLGRENETLIACQGPLDDEFGRFWRMVWQEGSEVIVMLTQPVEKRVQKCGVYFPEKVGQVMLVDENFRVSVQCLSVVEESGTLVRELKLVMGNEDRTIWHFYYPHWTDRAAPRMENQKTIVDLIKTSRFRIGTGGEGTEIGPRIIHCSAGVGRTGTFIALDYLLQAMVEWKNKEVGDIDPVFEIVKKLREQRTRMVMEREQFAFLYEMLGAFWGHCGRPSINAASSLTFASKIATAPLPCWRRIRFMNTWPSS